MYCFFLFKLGNIFVLKKLELECNIVIIKSNKFNVFKLFI